MGYTINVMNRQDRLLLPHYLTIFFLLILLPSITPQHTQCSQYVQKLLNDILGLKITSIPLPSLLYSGITTNNPGQMQQCLNSNYSYYLIFIKNTTLMLESFTGICVPSQCSADDVEIALEFLRCRVYDGGELEVWDGVGVVGGVVVGGWMLLVLCCSLFAYFRKAVINQYISQSPTNPQRLTLSSTTQPSQPDPPQISHPSSSTYSQPKQQQPYIFNYYQGYKKLFTISTPNTILSPIIFLAVVSYAVAVQFSYRQNIAENVGEVREVLDSGWGVGVCNVEIGLHTVVFVMGWRVVAAVGKVRKFTKIGRIFFDVLFRKWINLILMSLLVYSFSTLLINKPLSLLWLQTNGKDCPNYIWQIWFVFRNLSLDCKICLPWFSLLQADLLLTLLTAPLIILFKTTKKLGYFLIFVLIGASIFVSNAILKNQMIVFEPSRLMNGQKEFWIDYQGNAFVRMGAFYVGVLFGLIVAEGEGTDRDGYQEVERSWEGRICDFFSRRAVGQLVLSVGGLALMVYCYVLIRPYLQVDQQVKDPYMYIILAPLGFVLGLGLFTLPTFLQSPSPITKTLQSVLTHPHLIHLDRISLTFYTLSPMIIGYSTYCSQNSITYSLYTVFIYLLGDLFITYFLCIVVTAIFENQLVPIVGWIGRRILGKETRYGDVLVEYM